jgi:hypothetical protein
MQHTKVIILDDLDGTELDESTAVDVRFTWYGVEHELDLSPDHAADFQRALEPFLARARQVQPKPSGRPSSRPKGSGPRERVGREKSQAVRAWARGQGFDVAIRGQVSQELVDAYDAAQGGGR